MKIDCSILRDYERNMLTIKQMATKMGRLMASVNQRTLRAETVM